MNLLDLFSLFVLLVIIAVAVAILLTLAWLPGHFARKRHSPVKAISSRVTSLEHDIHDTQLKAVSQRAGD